jgi:DNA-binding CsgD family transcriptional regulator
MQILAPHYHLAYLRSTSQLADQESQLSSSTLTPREEEIMRWVAEGKTNWEISIILHMSLNTVKTHLKNIYQKLGGVENRWVAVARWQWNASGLLYAQTANLSHPSRQEL